MLILREKTSKGYDNIQIFIEPKGEHLFQHDKWKEEFLNQIHEQAEIRFSVQTDKYAIWGVPFYNHDNQRQQQNFAYQMEQVVQTSISGTMYAENTRLFCCRTH